MPPVEVYIVRHGERLDEVIAGNHYRKQEQLWKTKQSGLRLTRRKMPFEQAIREGRIAKAPPTDTFDPLLTARGHQQAHEAFSELFTALSSCNPTKKIAIFCSPLRRTIGTALMAGTVPTTSLAFPSPNQADPGVGASAAIPVTVLNGLGDFASAIDKAGGTAKLAPQGFLRCASMDANNGGAQSPFLQAVAGMPSQLQLSRTQQQKTRTVQFWKQASSSTWSTNNRRMIPMSPPIDAVCKPLVEDDGSFQYPKRKRSKKRGVLQIEELIDPEEAVNQAVRLTVARGCNVCVIVAHREAIRDMAERCSFHFGRISTPYCCIGSFGASVDSAGDVDYYYSNTWSPDRFSRESIPKHFPPLNPTSGRLALVSSVMLVVPGQAPKLLCIIQSQRRGGCLSSQVWFQDGNPRRNKHFRRSLLMRLPLLSHKERWNHALATLGFMDGFADFESGNGHFCMVAVSASGSSAPQSESRINVWCRLLGEESNHLGIDI